MKITDLIAEQQIDELGVADVAKGVGKVAKGVGSVAGGAVGAWDAAKKGFQAGRSAVAGGGATEPATTAAAANTQGPSGTAPAQAQTGAAGQALAKSAQAVADAGTDKKQGDALYAQIKASIGQLDPAGKKKILQLVQKSMSEKPAEPAAPAQSMADKVAAAQAPAAEPEATAPQAAAEPAATQQAAAPAAEPDAATQARIAAAPQGYDSETGKPIAAPQAEPAPTQQAAAPAAEPTAPAADGKLTAAQQAAKVAELKGKRAAGKTAGTAGSGFGNYVKKASGERIVGANKDGSVRSVNIKASKINTGNNLSESLARKIEQHKRKMFETGLANGTSSVFVK